MRSYLRRLNPFVFRAYYCVQARREGGAGTNVSIPLFSGRITARDHQTNPRLFRSQSLCFQGVLLRRSCIAWCRPFVSQSLCFQGVLLRVSTPGLPSLGCLNPFVFRAYYCAINNAKKVIDNLSQSLCFQGVLLRHRNRRIHTAQGVSIPLFSGRITAPIIKAGQPVGFVSIPLFSGRITARYICSMCAPYTSQSLCFQGVLLRRPRIQNGRFERVSIPLFSGRITAKGNAHNK